MRGVEWGDRGGGGEAGGGEDVKNTVSILEYSLLNAIFVCIG